MSDREYFIDLMKRIKVGSIISYVTDYKKESVLYIGEVYKIGECGQKGYGTHEGCIHCVGSIFIKQYKNNKFSIAGSKCFKKTSSWETRIKQILMDEEFIEEDEFML